MVVEDPSGRRVHQRFECELPVAVTMGEREIASTAVNISLGGLFLSTDEAFEYGAKVRLRFQLPSLKEPTEVEATVRWVIESGVGFQFGSLRALDVWGLNQLTKS